VIESHELAPAFGIVGQGTFQRVDLALAACRDKPDALFFTDDLEQQQRAKQVCHRCPVRWECLAYAFGAGQEDGIWGGLTPAERLVLKRRIRNEISV